MLSPFGGEIDGDPGIVVGGDFTGCRVHDGGHGDTPFVTWSASVVRLGEPTNAEDRIEAVWIEVEGPGTKIVGRPAQTERDDVFEAEEAPGDQCPVGPWTAPSRDEAVAIGFDGI